VFKCGGKVVLHSQTYMDVIGLASLEWWVNGVGCMLE
jgi:hypothetical protein